MISLSQTKSKFLEAKDIIEIAIVYNLLDKEQLIQLIKLLFETRKYTIDITASSDADIY